MDTNKQPGILFDSVVLKEISFSRQDKLSQNAELKVDFDYKVLLSQDKKQVICELSCVVIEKNNMFNIKCKMYGLFSVDDNNKNMDIQEFAEKNAPAHIFPFIRETIATTSAKAGIPPVILPPANIAAIIKNKAKTLKKN